MRAQEFSGVGFTAVNSPPQGCVSFSIARVDSGAAVEQGGADAGVAAARGHVERCAALDALGGVDPGSGVHKRAYYGGTVRRVALIGH